MTPRCNIGLAVLRIKGDGEEGGGRMSKRAQDYVELVEAVSRSLRRIAYLVCGDWHRPC